MIVCVLYVGTEHNTRLCEGKYDFFFNKNKFAIEIILTWIYRTSIVLGTAIPLILFLIWDAVILGTIPSLSSTDNFADPLEQLRSNNGIVGVR